VDGLVGTGVSGIFTQSAANANSPIRLVGDPGFVSLSSGSQHMCGVTAAKVTYCWGRNRYGGLTADAIPPTTVSGNAVYRGSR
jgi:alpha-tubulin suppressor-like RCC1 family protein